MPLASTHRHFVWVAILLWLAACASAPRRRYSVLREPAPPVIDEKELAEELDLPPDAIGYLVYDTDRKQVVAARNPQSPFLPASVGKVVTTIAALEILGPAHRFATTLAMRGVVRNETLAGDLYLKGGGDPLLSASELMDLASALRGRVRAVKGRFFFDNSELGERDRVHPLQDEDAVYNTSVGSLSSEFNRLALNWKSDHDALEAYLIPPLPIARLELTPQKAEGPGFTFRSSTEGDTWLLPADLAREGKRELPVHQAGLFTAELFARLAAAQGVTLTNPLPGELPKDATVLRTHWSEPLAELVARNLEWSNNLMAELFLLASARKLKARYATPGEAAGAIAGWWKKKLPQVPWTGFVAENGSGLSPHARLSPSQAVGILQWADRRRYDGRSYLSLLPISGMKGTLHTRLGSPQTALRVWAKTGTMKYGTSLAGYFFSKENRKHVFAIFVSDLEKRRALDEAAGGDPKQFRKLSEAGESWIDRGRKFQDAMLTKWILEN